MSPLDVKSPIYASANKAKKSRFNFNATSCMLEKNSMKDGYNNMSMLKNQRLLAS